MPQRNSVSYNSIISALCRGGQADVAWTMLSRMMADGLSPTHSTFAPILSSASPEPHLFYGIQLHPLILKSGLLHPDPFSATALLNLLAKNGELYGALNLFEEMPEPTVLTWNCIISAFSEKGFDADAMTLFKKFMNTGIRPTDCSFLSVLSAFRSTKSIQFVEQIHVLTIKSFFGSSMSVSNSLLNAYCNCFPLIFAEKFFSFLPAKDLISWNTFITFNAKSNNPDRIMEIYSSMSLEGFSPNETTFTGILSAWTRTGLTKHGEFIHAKVIKHNMNSVLCRIRRSHFIYFLFSDAFSLLSSSPAPETIKSLHAFSIICGSSTPLAVRHALITAYAAEDDISSARRVFDEMPQRNSVSYNSIISALCRGGQADVAWTMLSRMMADGLSPTHSTFAPILSSASPEPHLFYGIQLHPLILKSGLLHPDPFSATALLNLLAKNGELYGALNLFEEMPEPTVLTWNCIISAFSEKGFDADAMTLFKKFMNTGIRPTDCSFLSVLSAFCSTKSIQSVEQIHVLTIKSFFGSSMSVSNSLLNAYCNCFPLIFAEKFFSFLPAKDLISWNTFITFNAKSNNPDRIMEIYSSMSLEGFSPNETTFTGILSAWTRTGLTKHGEFIHAKVIKHNMNSSAYVGSSLVDLYAKNRKLEDAITAFMDIYKKNVVSWNSLISGFTNEHAFAPHLVIVKEMLASGFRPNETTFSSLLKSASISDARQIHSLVIKMGYESNDYVSSAIIASYSSHGHFSDALAYTDLITPSRVASSNAIAGIYNRNGEFEEAKDLVFQQEYPDNNSWNILITACAHNGNYLEAFQLFRRMQESGFLLDNYTAVSLLSICSRISGLDVGRSLHGLILKADAGISDVFVQNVLLDMYAKCGSLESCLNVFDEMPQRNLVSWTALVSGLGIHGFIVEALDRFREMEREGFVLDGVAFLAILSACRHGGLADEGIKIFNEMRCVHGVEPEMEHYVCVVDLLCRFGRLKEAEIVIARMPFQPNTIIWRVFLQGCKRYSFV